MSVTITVHKLEASGREVLAYRTRLLARDVDWVRVEGIYERPDVDFYGLTIRRGDRMLETFYSNRWYNVFAIHDGPLGALKGWYCNITRPARLEAAEVFAEDLALDLLVYPDGRTRVLDEDEFEELRLPPEEQAHARDALRELQDMGSQRRGPFALPADESAPA